MATNCGPSRPGGPPPTPWAPKFEECDQAAAMNFGTYLYWRSLLESSALTRFRWERLPGTVNPRYLEMCFLYWGNAAMFEPVPGELRVLPFQPDGIPDMQFDPTRVVLTSPNGHGTWRRLAVQQVTATPDGGLAIEPQTCACGFDNILRRPVMPVIDLYARRLGDIDRKIDINVSAQATPWIAEGTEQAMGDLMNKVAAITGNEPVVVQYEGMSTDTSLSVFQSQAPMVAPDLQTVRTREVNCIYTYLGIDNVYTDKKERSITGEMEANDEQIVLMRNSFLDERRKFCKACNDLFGTDVDVSWNVAHDPQGDVDKGDQTPFGMRRTDGAFSEGGV